MFFQHWNKRIFASVFGTSPAPFAEIVHLERAAAKTPAPDWGVGVGGGRGKELRIAGRVARVTEPNRCPPARTLLK